MVERGIVAPEMEVRILRSVPREYLLRGVAQSGQSSRFGTETPQVQILLPRPKTAIWPRIEIALMRALATGANGRLKSACLSQI